MTFSRVMVDRRGKSRNAGSVRYRRGVRRARRTVRHGIMNRRLYSKGRKKRIRRRSYLNRSVNSGHQTFTQVYHEGFQQGFAKGYEDGHQMAYAGQV